MALIKQWKDYNGTDFRINYDDAGAQTLTDPALGLYEHFHTTGSRCEVRSKLNRTYRWVGLGLKRAIVWTSRIDAINPSPGQWLVLFQMKSEYDDTNKNSPTIELSGGTTLKLNIRTSGTDKYAVAKSLPLLTEAEYKSAQFQKQPWDFMMYSYFAADDTGFIRFCMKPHGATAWLVDESYAGQNVRPGSGPLTQTYGVYGNATNERAHDLFLGDLGPAYFSTVEEAESFAGIQSGPTPPPTPDPEPAPEEPKTRTESEYLAVVTQLNQANTELTATSALLASEKLNTAALSAKIANARAALA